MFFNYRCRTCRIASYAATPTAVDTFSDLIASPPLGIFNGFTACNISRGRPELSGPNNKPSPALYVTSQNDVVDDAEKP